MPDQSSNSVVLPPANGRTLVPVTDWAELKSGDHVLLQHDQRGFSRGTVDLVTFDYRTFWLRHEGVQTRRMIHIEDGYKVRKIHV